ncbi:MAG: DUF4173 domain-containing protein [Eubacteriaceae bacterium]|nr:DUF4173 domain-containing protein [Eubacteriaceae bacterium]
MIIENMTDMEDQNSQTVPSTEHKNITEVSGYRSYTPPEKTSRVYEAYEAFFALLAILAGYLFIKTDPTYTPFYGSLMIIAMYAYGAFFIRMNGKKSNVIYMLFAAIMAVSIFINGENIISFYAYCAAVLGWCVYVFTSFSGGQAVSDWFFADSLKAIFVMPFSAFGSVFGALASAVKDKGSTKKILTAIAALAASLIPCAMIISLLSYDSEFARIMNRICEAFDIDFWSEFTVFLFSIPCSMYIFGCLIGNKDGRKSDVLTHERCSAASMNARSVAPAACAAFSIPILAVYAVFFFSQKELYLSAFTGQLPKGYIYSSYAVEGFFELVKVSVINAAVILAVERFGREDTEVASTFKKVNAVIFILVTLILMSTAFAKLMLYISIYGMTLRRMLAGWFLSVLAACFVLAAVKQFVPDFKLTKAIVYLCTAAFVILCLVSPARLIANYNVNAYLSGQIRHLDIRSFRDLGYSAIEPLARALESNKLPADLKENIKNFLEYKSDITYSDPVGTLSLPYIRAMKILRSLGFIN